MGKEKVHISLVVIGHVDAGKFPLGCLMYDGDRSGAVASVVTLMLGILAQKLLATLLFWFFYDTE
jgi:hypothetical protein